MTRRAPGCILEHMSDRLHDHVSFGFHAGCPACEQVAEVFAAHPESNDVELLSLVAV